MHILIAPNAFKNSLDAGGAARAISEGLRVSRLSCTTSCFPIADGGDGTGSLLIQYLKGKTVPVMVSDPLGRKIQSSFGLVDNGKTAIIELADASGLRRLQRKEYDPMHTTTRGTGETIKQALDLDVDQIILAIGGSATVDGGSGILEALGVGFHSENGKPIIIPDGLDQLDKIEFAGLDPRIFNTQLTILCDVENPLLGKSGAAAVFGPQKGAKDQDIAQLEARLTKLSAAGLRLTEMDMSIIKRGGAAGGVAAGLAVFLEARLVNGIDYFLDQTGFDRELEQADLLITAEGGIDAQTAGGKGPLGAAKRAKARGIPVIALAGRVPLEFDKGLYSFFDVILPINHQPMNMSRALENTAINLKRTSRAIGDLLSFSGKTNPMTI